MSIQLIQAALETKLATLTPAMATVYENTSFTPVTGVAYQRVYHLLNKPTDLALGGDLVQDQGIFQITLAYPQNAGRGAAMARAQMVRDHFRPPLTLTNGAVKVEIVKTARIAGGMTDADRWTLPVSIEWAVYSNPLATP